MADLHRLAFLFFASLCVMFAGRPAHAQTAPAQFPAYTATSTSSQVTTWATNGGAASTGTYPAETSKQAACADSYNDALAYWGRGYGTGSSLYTGAGIDAVDPTCDYHIGPPFSTHYSFTYTVGTKTASTFSCPGGGASNGNGSCICPQGQSSLSNGVDGVCRPTQVSVCQAIKGFTDFITLPGKVLAGTVVCLETGCNAQMSSTVIWIKDKGGSYSTKGDAAYDGTGCSYSPTTSSTNQSGATEPSATKDPCPAGQQASMNGVTVCQPGFDPSLNVVQSVKTTTSSGSTTSTPSGSSPTTTPSPLVTQTDDTTCTGQVCVINTTKTSTNADGSSSSSTAQTTQPKVDYCAQNPKAVQCGGATDPSSFSAADCNSPPVCKGDAVACATAAYAFKTQCQLQDPKSTEQALYDVERGKTGDQTAGLATNRAFGITGSTFDQTDLIGNPQGVADLTTSVMGNPVTIKLSLVNPWLVVLGDVLMALTALVCLRVVFRSE